MPRLAAGVSRPGDHQPRDPQRYDFDEAGVHLGGMLDTPNYGALSLDANLRTSAGRSDSSGNLFSLHQIGLPMDGGWLVNNSLGVTNAPAVDLARSQYRFFVPVILSNGATTEWRNPDHGLQLHASIGQPGLLTGIYVPTFEDLGAARPVRACNGATLTAGRPRCRQRTSTTCGWASDLGRQRRLLAVLVRGRSRGTRRKFGSS